MKADQLREALLLAEARDQNIAMRDRLAGGEALGIIVGEGQAASRLVLLPAYVERIRRELVADLNHKIGLNEAAMRDRGVEP